MNKISGEEGRGIGGDRGGDLIDCSAIVAHYSAVLEMWLFSHKLSPSVLR